MGVWDHWVSTEQKDGECRLKKFDRLIGMGYRVLNSMCSK